MSISLSCYEGWYDLRMPEDPGPPPREPTRQLNVLIPDRLHRKMKIRAATTGVPMKDQVLRWIEQEYGDNDE